LDKGRLWPISSYGGGVSGHTAATFAKKWLGKEHEVVVVTPIANGTGYHLIFGLELER